MPAMRDHIVEVTCDLLEAQGYRATGLNQIIAKSGAPKGSLYYYFPGGKEELVGEAIARTSAILAQRIRAGIEPVGAPATAFRAFLERVADHVDASGFRAGGPLTTVALETVHSSERLNAACRQAYDVLQDAFAERLRACGYPAAQAAAFATTITAAAEGGILLSRTYHSAEPLRRVAAAVGRLLAETPPPPSGES